MNVVSVLGVLFIALKLLDVIAWSWWWVLLPFYFWFIFLAIVCIIYYIKEKINE